MCGYFLVGVCKTQSLGSEKRHCFFHRSLNFVVVFYRERGEKAAGHSLSLVPCVPLAWTWCRLLVVAFHSVSH